MNLIEDYDEMSFTEEYVLQVISDTIDSIEHRTDLQFIGFRRILMLSLEMVNTLGDKFYHMYALHNYILKLKNNINNNLFMRIFPN